MASRSVRPWSSLTGSDLFEQHSLAASTVTPGITAPVVWLRDKAFTGKLALF